MSRSDSESRSCSAEDAARIDGYVEGQGAAFREVDGWIRVEMRARYPGLGAEHEDLAQVVHSRLLPLLREGRFGGRSALRTFVIGIAHHVAIDRVRQLRRQRNLLTKLEREPLPRPSSPNEDGTKRDPGLLHEAMQSLPESCRELWRLIFLEKLGYDAIASRLAIPAGTVKSRAYHCRKKAMAALERLRRSRSTAR